MPGALVWCRDLTRFGFEPDQGQSQRVFSEKAVEQILGGKRTVRSDGTGRFVLKGLLDRSYTLASLAPSLLADCEDQLVEAGSDGIRLVINDHSVMVSGHVLALDDSPLVGVTVQAMQLPTIVGNSWSGLDMRLSPPVAKTDDKGYFLLGPVAIGSNTLSVLGKGVTAFHAARLSDESNLHDIEIRIARRVSLQVNLERDPQLASTFEILDKDEVPIIMHITSARGVSEAPSGNLLEGLSSVVHTTQEAQWLVLKKSGIEVQRVRLTLIPDELNVIKP